MAWEKVKKPECDLCGGEYFVNYDEQPLCTVCFAKVTREQGLRGQENTTWHRRLDRILDDRATDKDKELYGVS